MTKNNFFRYNKKIDAKIGPAVEQVLNVAVKRVVKMKHGEVNHVYKVVTEKDNLLIRVFQYSTWPEPGKLQWIEKQLSKHKIPHAKILYYSRSPKFFPHGFMVTEFIEGWNGNQAASLEKISLADVFKKTGQVLKKVHAIRVQKYGSIRYGRGENSDYLNFKLKQIRGNLKSLEKNKAVEANLYSRVSAKLKAGLSSFENKLSPVLNHSDANRDNVILAKTGEWVLIDWDNSYAGIWPEDFTELTYWAGWKRKPKAAEQRRKLITENFFKGYGKHNFRRNEFEDIEKYLHIIKAVSMMSYYYNVKKSFEEFKKSKQKLLRLLE